MNLFKLFESKELATELIWFRRFISENDLETEIEVEGNELVVYQDGKELCKWDATEANRIRVNVLTDAKESRHYAQYILDGRFELGEPVIATNAVQSRYYAQYVLERRFKLGEPTIATDANEARWYAQNIVRGRFKLGEPTIATNVIQSCLYAKDVLKGRFKLGEPVIATNAVESCWYAENALKGPFKLGEKVIATNPAQNRLYKEFLASLKVVKDLSESKNLIPLLRFINEYIAEHNLDEIGFSAELENGSVAVYKHGDLVDEYNPDSDIIDVLSDPDLCSEYACEYSGKRFEFGEPIIAQSSIASVEYAKHLGKRFELGERVIAEDEVATFTYAIDVLNKRFHLGEETLKQNDVDLWQQYSEIFKIK